MKNKIDNYILYSLILFSVYCAVIIGISWDELDHLAEEVSGRIGLKVNAMAAKGKVAQKIITKLR